MSLDRDLERAAQAVAHAEAMLIGAGAGMGVDSGLPDFRGDQGFWRAYPPIARLGLSFVEMANPQWFEDDRCGSALAFFRILFQELAQGVRIVGEEFLGAVEARLRDAVGFE